MIFTSPCGRLGRRRSWRFEWRTSTSRKHNSIIATNYKISIRLKVQNSPKQQIILAKKNKNILININRALKNRGKKLVQLHSDL